MNRAHRLLAITLAIAGAIAMLSPAYAKPGAKGKVHPQHQKSGQRLLGDKIKVNGNHAIEKIGKNTVSVAVRDGKVTGVHVKHSEKGDVPVTKYKTTQKMASADRIVFASYQGTQLAQYMGTTYIGYSFIDEYGDEYIYWFPYDMIYDGDADAILYVPAG